MKPLVSIIVEAYNDEYNQLAPPADTLDALLRQDFPLEQVELILIGSGAQIEHWKELRLELPAFSRVKMVSAEVQDAHYWQLKNQAAAGASGELVAFADCDVVPVENWLSTAVSALRSGADVSVGPSQYRTGSLPPYSPWMLAAALPSWSFTLSTTSTRKKPKAGSLLSHNVALRRDVLLQHPFSPLHRSFNSSLLYFELVRSGAKISYQPAQKVAHGVSFRWWSRIHFRRGWETYAGRDLDPDWPRLRLSQKLRLIEPILLRMGLVCRDARHWFRFSRVLGVGAGKAILLFPLAVGASFFARTAEMIGMYSALFAPKATEHQARF